MAEGNRCVNVADASSARILLSAPQGFGSELIEHSELETWRHAL